MGDVLGYARVSTADQDVPGQTMRLTQAGAIKVFTDVRSGRSLDRPGLDSLLAYAREGATLAVVRWIGSRRSGLVEIHGRPARQLGLHRAGDRVAFGGEGIEVDLALERIRWEKS